MPRLSLFNLAGPTIVITLALSSLVFPWGTYQLRPDDFDRAITIPPYHHGYGEPSIISIYADGLRLSVSGANGQALVWPISFRYWICPALIILSALALFGVIHSRIRLLTSITLAAVAMLITLIAVADLLSRGGLALLSFGWLPCVISAAIVLRYCDPMLIDGRAKRL